MHITKHCEWCGEIIDNPYYASCVSLESILFGKCKDLAKIDEENSEFVLNDGSVLHFDFQISATHYVTVHKICEQLLCSEKCEDEFVAKYTCGPLWTEEFETANAQLILTKNNLFRPIIINRAHLKHEIKQCEICASPYPSLGRKITENGLLNRQVGNLEPNDDLQKVVPKSEPYIVVTSQGKKSKKAHWFAYRQSEQAIKPRNLCSYDCMYQLAKQNHTMIITESVLAKDRLGIITEDTEQINAELFNSIPHRPSFLGFI
ncbi:hypothetical protein KAZ92_01970 [Candidatus Gracilibacteria bacterium]|nr:hypothetical protein [Candidatus Gracilibacteria bacterium]